MLSIYIHLLFSYNISFRFRCCCDYSYFCSTGIESILNLWNVPTQVVTCAYSYRYRTTNHSSDDAKGGAPIIMAYVDDRKAQTYPPTTNSSAVKSALQTAQRSAGPKPKASPSPSSTSMAMEMENTTAHTHSQSRQPTIADALKHSIHY